ncbi:hypothetical protein TWF788_007368 [Orbilia oligospora]|uniref:Uncharacterized protein n=1 Tax=Orbilia oligospora TaxID=2813651 RepID=A0A7C8PT63_ORBOL|nr:hypothetical protein TWF788_007368 [Orbilia oligospora]
MRPRRMPVWHYCCYALTLLMSLYSFLPGSLAVPMLDNNSSALAINPSTSIPAAASTLPFKYTDLSTTTASNTSSQARSIEGSSPADFKHSIDRNDTKRVVSPNIFITGWQLICPAPYWIITNMDANARNYPKFRTGPKQNDPDGRRRPYYIGHASEFEDCYCKVTAGQPLPVEGESYEAHLDALRRLPQAFRDQLPDYEWAPPGTAINARPNWLEETPPPFASAPEPELEEPPELVDIDQLESLLLDTAAAPYARQPTLEGHAREPNGGSAGGSDGDPVIGSSAGPSRGPTLYGPNDRLGWRQPRRYYDPVRGLYRPPGSYYDPVRGLYRPPGGGSAPPPLLRRRDHSPTKRELSMSNQVGNAQIDETTNAQ